MGKKRKIISQRNLWKKHSNHPAIKARQSKENLADETVAAQPKPKKVEVKPAFSKPAPKVAAKPAPKPALKKAAVKSAAKPEMKKKS